MTTSLLPFLPSASGARAPTASSRICDACASSQFCYFLTLRQIQHIVDQREQMLAGRSDAREILHAAMFAGILGILAQHLAVADDGVERRTQLVTHVCQECALGAAGFFGSLFGRNQFLLHALALGDFIAQIGNMPLQRNLGFAQRQSAGLNLPGIILPVVDQDADLIVTEFGGAQRVVSFRYAARYQPDAE